ncbi:hypothetical protein B0T11DRAFT_302888 [Plectosphaerella cucumerina]|uniref:Uncharacterized protein n=1 Tax=Plectosphaerella cucumerina TaxID=40658 RepID=A0A8K0TAP0_9PEZI|nr:hypothetical protein B0T11DRAFT_302888 [Plectosphaerella cucumerina]
MTYFSPSYAPHFNRDLSAASYDPLAFNIPEGHHRPRLVTTKNNTWHALAKLQHPTTPEERTEQSYRTFQSACYSSAPGTPTLKPSPPVKEADWWPPRLRRVHGKGNLIALARGWLCVLLLAGLAFAAFWVFGSQNTAPAWIREQSMIAGRRALGASIGAARKVIRKIRGAAKLGVCRASDILKAAPAWLLSISQAVVSWVLNIAVSVVRQAADLFGDAMDRMRTICLRVYRGLPRCEVSSLRWLLPSLVAVWMLLTLQQQKSTRDMGPVYVLVSRFQSHGSGPWPLPDRL